MVAPPADTSSGHHQIEMDVLQEKLRAGFLRSGGTSVFRCCTYSKSWAMSFLSTNPHPCYQMQSGTEHGALHVLRCNTMPRTGIMIKLTIVQATENSPDKSDIIYTVKNQCVQIGNVPLCYGTVWPLATQRKTMLLTVITKLGLSDRGRQTQMQKQDRSRVIWCHRVGHRLGKGQQCRKGLLIVMKQVLDIIIETRYMQISLHCCLS